MKIDQLRVRLTSVALSAASVTQNTSQYRPFGIKLARNEVLALYALWVNPTPVDAPDVDSIIEWALLQQDLVAGNNVVPPLGVIRRRDSDGDIVARGMFTTAQIAANQGLQAFVPQWIYFPDVIWVPRSPTLEFITSSATQDLFLSASLYYKKYVATDDQVRQLMKQYKG